MEKYVYIFNGSSKLDLMLALRLYKEAQKNIPELMTYKYSCFFKCNDGRLCSRRASVKNIEINFPKYLQQLGETTSLSSFNILEETKKTDTLKDINENGPGLVIRAENNTFNVYLITLNPLPEHQILDIWLNYSIVTDMNYMVSYSMDSNKFIEYTMFGIITYHVDLTLKERECFYTKTEREIIDLLHDLRIYETRNLKHTFPLCIATEKAIVDEQGYASKKKIDSKTYFFSK